MPTRTQLEEMAALLRGVVEDVDAEIIDAIRRNNGKHGGRPGLLAELDVLDMVRERLNVRLDELSRTGS